MRILFIDGEDDFSAMHFEEEFPDMERVAREFLPEGCGFTHIEFTDSANMTYFVTLSIKEFGEVDEDFIAWISDEYIDYDVTKAKNFHILKEDAE